MRRLVALLVCLTAAVAGAAIVAVAPPAGAQVVPRDDPTRGLIYAGLRPGAAGSACQGAFEVMRRAPSAAGNEGPRCTHGPDPVPVDVDPRPGQDPQFRAADAPAGGAEATAAASGTVPCYGDGTDAYRVQLIYARDSTTASRYADYEANFRDWAARMDDVVNTSAAATGGIRHIRFVTDAQCHPVISQVTVSTGAVDDVSVMADELAAQGFSRSDRKYLVWVDDPSKSTYCGIGYLLNDTRHDPTPGVNRSNGAASEAGLLARVDARCWGQTNMVEVHELVHTLGGVQSAPGHTADAAPHATNNSHCFDEYDRMCYADAPGGGDPVTGPVFKADGSPTTLQIVCPARSHEALLDCGNDDYFHTNPPPGNYLATHWNTAESAWLARSSPPGTADTLTAGSAWYSNGVNGQSGPAGTSISVYGVGLFTNVPYQLMTGRKGDSGQPCQLDLVAVNTNTRFANSSGFVSATAGIVNRLPGTYQVCFAQVDPVSGSRAVSGTISFTVT